LARIVPSLRVGAAKKAPASINRSAQMTGIKLIALRIKVGAMPMS